MFNQVKSYSFSDRLIQINIRQLFFYSDCSGTSPYTTPRRCAHPSQEGDTSTGSVTFFPVVELVETTDHQKTKKTNHLSIRRFGLINFSSLSKSFPSKTLFPFNAIILCWVVISILFNLIQHKSQPKISRPRGSFPVLCGFCLCRDAACCALCLDLGSASPAPTI
jgi:hypothetical protein